MHWHVKQTGMKVHFRIKEYAQTAGAGGFDVLLEFIQRRGAESAGGLR